MRRQISIEELRERLSRLDHSRKALQERQRALDEAAKKVVIDDPAAAVSRLAAVNTERDATNQALALADEQGRELQRELKAAEAAERERLLTQALAALDQPRRTVVAAVLGLRDALDEFQTGAREVLRHGGTPTGVHSDLFGAVERQMYVWRTTSPALLGLPEPPTTKQVAIAETQAEIQRLRKLLGDAEKFDENVSAGRDVQQLLQTRKRAIRLAEDHLCRLQGREPAEWSASELRAFGLVQFEHDAQTVIFASRP